MQPQHFGILALEVYFPNQYVSVPQLAVPLPLGCHSCVNMLSISMSPSQVDQAELEELDGVSSGKYTVGLGQVISNT